MVHPLFINVYKSFKSLLMQWYDVYLGQTVGDSLVRLGRVPAESECHPEKMGLSGAHFWTRGIASGGGPLQKG